MEVEKRSRWLFFFVDKNWRYVPTTVCFRQFAPCIIKCSTLNMELWRCTDLDVDVECWMSNGICTRCQVEYAASTILVPVRVAYKRYTAVCILLWTKVWTLQYVPYFWLFFISASVFVVQTYHCLFLYTELLLLLYEKVVSYQKARSSFNPESSNTWYTRPPCFATTLERFENATRIYSVGDSINITTKS